MYNCISMITNDIKIFSCLNYGMDVDTLIYQMRKERLNINDTTSTKTGSRFSFFQLVFVS